MVEVGFLPKGITEKGENEHLLDSSVGLNGEHQTAGLNGEHIRQLY